FCDADLAVRDASDVGRIEGMRGYLAIEGGIEEMPTILRKGDTLWSVAAAFRPPIGGLKPAATRTDRLTIRIMRGPHDAPPLPSEWAVTRELNRVGIRMRPIAPIDFKPPADLPSCGAQFGTIQWHADGSIVALGPDHPITGGYLQPATVLSTELWKLAQLAPGDRVKLIAV